METKNYFFSIAIILLFAVNSYAMLTRIYNLSERGFRTNTKS